MIRKKQKSDKIVIDISGPDGNAYCLLGYARRFSKDLGKDYDKIRKDMTSSGYEHLLKVFDREFGDFVILER